MRKNVEEVIKKAYHEHVPLPLHEESTLDKHYRQVLAEVVKGFDAMYSSLKDRIEALKKTQPRRIVPPPRDVQVKEVVEDLDKRLSDIENQVAALMSPRAQPQSGGIVIFKGKAKSGGENGK